MNAILEKKAALAEDTILRAIAPAMKKRQAARRKADRKRRINETLARAGCLCGSSEPVPGRENKRQALCA